MTTTTMMKNTFCFDLVWQEEGSIHDDDKKIARFLDAYNNDDSDYRKISGRGSDNGYDKMWGEEGHILEL